MPQATRAALLAVLSVAASGLVSAGLVLAVETESLVRLMLLALAPLPLFVSGLSAGMLSCATAGLVGAVVVTLAMGTGNGAVYLVAGMAPVTVLVRLALRGHKADEGGMVWSSGGNLLLWLAGLGVAGVLGAIAYLDVFKGGLVATIGGFLDLPTASAAMLARVIPGLAVAGWMAVLVVDGVGAEWLLTQTGLAARPPVDFGKLTLPMWIGPVLMVAGLAGAVLREGTLGILCLNCAIVLIVPFAFLGLATIHTLARGRANGSVLLAAAYVLLLGSPALLGWNALLIWALMLAGLGTVDQFLDLRGLRGLRDGWKRK